MVPSHDGRSHRQQGTHRHVFWTCPKCKKKVQLRKPRHLSPLFEVHAFDFYHNFLSEMLFAGDITRSRAIKFPQPVFKKGAFNSKAFSLPSPNSLPTCVPFLAFTTIYRNLFNGISRLRSRFLLEILGVRPVYYILQTQTGISRLLH